MRRSISRLRETLFHGSCLGLTLVALSCAGGGGGGSDNENTNDNVIPERMGACCQPDGGCLKVAQVDCVETYLGDDTECAACPESAGACCLDDGSCTILPPAECDGAYLGHGSQCLANACSLSPFTEEAEKRGVDLLVIYGRDDEAGSGLAFVDLDLDGDPDLVVLGQVGDGIVGVFENDGKGFFADRSADTGIPPSPLARGISAADYDDDGDLDLYFTCWLQPNVLLRNDGNFRFTDVTSEAGVGGVGHGAGSAWGDYDGDGWVDLYVANWEYTDHNFMYHNLGNGRFEEVAGPLGVDSLERSYQPVLIDYDKDSDLDLYLSNDNRVSNCGPEFHNRLFRNTGGTFADVSMETGADICMNSMGVAVGDLDGNLYLDLYFTNLPPGNFLLLNQGDGTFVERSAAYGLDTPGSTGWGTAAFDYDNDGFEEFFVLNANDANRFYEHDGTIPLQDIAPTLGLDEDGASYCLALADVDNDGDLDIAESVRQQRLKLHINQEGQKRHWVKFRVVGEGRNRFGIGTTVTIRTGERSQIRHLLFGNNYKSQNEALLHFGLRSARSIDEIEIVWPGGTTRTLRNYAAEQTWALIPPEQLGDWNGDGAVDSNDAAGFANCQGTIRPGCEALDVDGDGVIGPVDESLMR